MAPVTINGNTIDPDTRADGTPSPWTSNDAANTNYIYIQVLGLRGAIGNSGHQQLRHLGVTIFRYKGSGTYLCRYVPTDLEVLRALSFVRHANVYHKVFKTSGPLKPLLQRQDNAEVWIGLHDGARSSEKVAEQIVEAPGIQRDTISAHPGFIVCELSSDALSHLVDIDDVREIQYKAPIFLY